MKRYILAGLLSVVSVGFVINTASAQMVGDVDPGSDNSSPCVNLTYNLKLGSKDSGTGGQVTLFQEFLVMKGFLTVDPTGYFGPATLAAAKAYQAQASLLNSGYVGPLTRAAIKSASCSGTTAPIGTESSTTVSVAVTNFSTSSILFTYANAPANSQAIIVTKPMGERIGYTSAMIYTGGSGSGTLPSHSLAPGMYAVRLINYSTLAQLAESATFTISQTSPTCATGSTYNGTSCVPVCHSEQSLVNGQCVAISTTIPSITLTPDMTIEYGKVATLTWSVTPSNNVSCVAAGGNLANGTYMSASSSWTTPPLYTTTQYGMKCTNYTNGLSTTKYVTVTVTPKTTTGTAPVITLTPDTSVAYGGTTNITWNVTPSTGVTCVAAGGNLASGTTMGTTGSWTTPPLYTTTQYGMRCTDTTSGLNSYKYTTVSVAQASAPQITLTPDTTTTFGGTATLTWSVTPSTGVSCVSAGGNLANGTYMNTYGTWTTPPLYTTTQYGMKCTNNTNGLSSIKFVNVSVPAQTADSTSSSAPTITLTPDQTIPYGGSMNITWNVTPSAGVTCVAAGGNLASGMTMGTTGSWTTPTLYTNTQYGMRCTNSTGLTSYKYVNVYVATPSAPAVTLTSDKATAAYGGTATLTWSATPSTNVTCVAAGGNIASGTTVGAFGTWTTLPLYTTTQYGLRCTDQISGLSTTKYVTVSVASQTPTSASAPVITVSSNVTIPYGTNTTLRWTVTPTTNVSCLVAGGNLASGTSVGASGTWTTPDLYTSTQYGIQCTDTISGYSSTKYVQVTVSPQATTNTTTDTCAALDASLYCTTESCTTNTGVVRYGTKNCAVDACAALDASQYCTTQSCTTNTGVVRYGTKNCTVSSMSGAVAIAQRNMSSVLGAFAQCIDLPMNMHRGYESYGVTRLQEFLKSKNFLGEVTGYYGDKTVTAVKEYQASKGLPATGMVYDFTRATIKADSCQ